MEKRLDWIDYCKAIAIFSMVFLHVGYKFIWHDQNIDEMIHLWHMPVFFLLSGVVLNTQKYLDWSNFPQFVKNRFRTIIIPYLIFGFILCLFQYVVENFLHISRSGGEKSLGV